MSILETKKKQINQQSKPILAVALMVKNEIKTIEKTIQSASQVSNIIILLDTGSTDGTQILAEKIAKKCKINLHLFEQPFIDFSVSRNNLLNLARPFAHFLLLIDANEELRGSHLLRPMLKKHMNADAFTVTLRIMNDAGMIGMETIFHRICIIRSDESTFHYEGKIHETICCDPNIRICKDLINHEFHIYQDKEKDTLQAPRFKRDIVFLLEELKENPKNLRKLYYLGITYRNIREEEKALDAFQKRIEYASSDKFFTINYSDEYYMSHVHSMELCINMKKPQQLLKKIFVSAMKYLSIHNVKRCDHYITISGYYLERLPLRLDDIKKAVQFSKSACIHPMPKNDYRLLIKTGLYDHIRWLLYARAVHLLGTFSTFQGKDNIFYKEAISRISKEEYCSLGDGIKYEPIAFLPIEEIIKIEEAKIELEKKKSKVEKGKEIENLSPFFI